MLGHLSIQCADVAAGAASCDRVLAALGASRVLGLADAVGFGAAGKPVFWNGLADQRRGVP